MKMFFHSEDRRRELVAAGASWIGTPFVGFTRRRGVGVDCVNLAAAVYLECGVAEKFEPFPDYVLDHSQHSDVEQLIAYIERTGRFRLVSGPDLPSLVLPGDLLCFNWALSSHHVGLALTPKLFIHTYLNHCVMESAVLDTHWKRGLARIYRPLEREAAQ